MTPIIIALAFAVLATLWWAAKPISRNYAENDESTYDTKETKWTPNSRPDLRS